MKLMLDVEAEYHVNTSNMAWHTRSTGASLPRLAKHCQIDLCSLSIRLIFCFGENNKLLVEDNSLVLFTNLNSQACEEELFT